MVTPLSGEPGGGGKWGEHRARRGDLEIHRTATWRTLEYGEAGLASERWLSHRLSGRHQDQVVVGASGDSYADLERSGEGT